MILVWLRRLDRILFKVIDILVILLVGIITVAVIATVFSRYVLNNSFSWGEELPGLLLVSLTFIGSGWLARYDQHLAFDGLVMAMPPRLQFGIRIFNLILIEAFLGCLIYFGWVVVESTGSTSLVTLNFPLAIFRAMVPIGSTVMMLGYGVHLGQLVLEGPRTHPANGSDDPLPVDEADRILASMTSEQTTLSHSSPPSPSQED